MSLEKPIEQVVEADLRTLIENQVSERKTSSTSRLFLGGRMKRGRSFSLTFRLLLTRAGATWCMA